MPDSKSSENEFVQLLAKHGRWIYAYIITLVPSGIDADEVFQETNMTLWKKFDEFETGTNFRAWAFRVAYYEVLRYRQQKKGFPTLLGDAFVEAVDRGMADKRDQMDDLHLALETCLGKLDEADRELVQRRYRPGATIKAIATEDNRSQWSVYRALSRIHQALYYCIHRRMAAGVES